MNYYAGIDVSLLTANIYLGKDQLRVKIKLNRYQSIEILQFPKSFSTYTLEFQAHDPPRLLVRLVRVNGRMVEGFCKF